MAATQDRTRFSRINGNGSNASAARIVLTTIHKSSTPVNEKMNAQLPANFAIASAARCPKVYFSAVGLSEILLSASRFKTSSSVISCRISLRTSFRSFRFSFIKPALSFRNFCIIIVRNSGAVKPLARHGRRRRLPQSRKMPGGRRLNSRKEL